MTLPPAEDECPWMVQQDAQPRWRYLCPKHGTETRGSRCLDNYGGDKKPTNDWHWIYHQTEMHVQFLWAKTYTYWVYTPERSSVDICQIPWASGGTPTFQVNDSTSLGPPITAPRFLRPVTSAPGCSTCLCLWPKQLLSFQGHGPASPIMNPGVSSNLDTGPCEDKSWLQTWHNRTVFTVMKLINVPCVCWVGEEKGGWFSFLSTIWKVSESCAEFCSKLCH